jgi:hypothetical protein
VVLLLLVGGGAVAFLVLGGDGDSGGCDGDEIGTDDRVTGQVSSGEPARWCVEVSEGRLEARVTASEDTTLELLDEDEARVAFNDDDDGFDPAIDTRVDDGVYTLEVALWSDNVDGEVGYTLATGSEADALRGSSNEPSGGSSGGSSSGTGDCGSLPTVGLGDTHEGSIDSTGVDEVCLEVDDDGTDVVVRATSDDDTALTLFDEDGSEVAYNDDDDGLDPALEVVLDAGTYRIEVSTWGGGSSDAYTLEVGR